MAYKLCVLIGLFCSMLLSAAAPPVAPSKESLGQVGKPHLEMSGGPYCGIYSAYAALRAIGIEARFADLLESEYVGSFYGSTVAELKQAIVDFGGHAEAMEGLTASALRNSQHPIILHVRRPGLKTVYAHWVLFLGVEGDKARIVDPPNAVELLPFAELLSLWDGTGLVVSQRPVRTWSIRVGAWLEATVFLLLVVALLGGARLAIVRLGEANRLVRAPLMIASLLLLAVGVAVLTHGIHDEGFFRNRPAVGQIVLQHFEPKFSSVTIQEVRTVVDKPGIVFIDARTPWAFQVGHIPKAINLPVHAGLSERSQVLRTIKPTARVIVYCQSEHCSWGDKIAADLAFRGFNNVELFPGGYNEWEQSEPAKSDR